MRTKEVPSSKTQVKSQKSQVSSSSSHKKEVFRIIAGIVFFLVALVSICAFISFLMVGAEDQKFLEGSEGVKALNWMGGMGAWWSDFWINCHFGFGAFILPIYCTVVALKLTKIGYVRLWKWTINSIFLLAWISVASTFFLRTYFESSYIEPGGMHGINASEWMEQYIGSVGVFLVIILSFIGYLCYVSTETVLIIKKLLHPQQLARDLNKKYPILSRIVNLVKKDGTCDDAQKDVLENDDLQSSEDETSESSEEIAVQYDDNGIPIAPVDDSAITDTSWISIGGDGEAEKEEEQKPPVPFESLGENLAQESIPEPSATEAEFVIEQPIEEEVADVDSQKALEPYDPKLDLEHYRYPTLDLLIHYDLDPRANIDMEEQTANKNQIVRVLEDFGVTISSIKATVGPTITLYEITPAPGVRISKIRNLEADIALSLSALGIRIIAPIPGKGTVGIEVPNAKPQIVSMESILNSRKFQETAYELPMALGKTITNEVFMADLAKMPHLLVAGATGQGKSVGLNAIITSLLYKKHPAELKLVMVDPKKVEFSIYSPIVNHFLAHIEDDDDDPIITDVQKVINTLKSLCVEMDTRYDLLKKARARNIKEYNEKFKQRQLNPQHGHRFMPYIVVIIDEFGDLIMTAGKEIELPIARIAQLARAVGMHMIIATQRPTTNIITGTIKANFPARMAFKVSSMIDSRTILDRPGANQLVGKGDMLFLAGNEPVRVQCAFVDTPEVERVTDFIAHQQGYSHAFDLPRPPVEDGGSGTEEVDMQHLDPMFADVARLIVTTQQGSTSMVQRKFAIGYNRAGRLMDQLEKAGIVGAAQGAKPREVLIQDDFSLENLLSSMGV